MILDPSSARAGDVTTDQPDILSRIVAYKKREVAELKSRTTLAALEARAQAQTAPRGFERKIREMATGSTFPIIAEIKKASPSKGLIRADFEPADLARAYETGGAACLSVLTDGPSFQGSPAHFEAARDAVSLPLLRKDFMIDPAQIVESRAMGADAILLILACLDDDELAELAACARFWGMDILAECHDASEVARALSLDGAMIGVNNRNLRNFHTSLQVSEDLARLIPPSRLMIAESGLNVRADLVRLWACGARGFLIGETFMREDDPGARLRDIATRL